MLVAELFLRETLSESCQLVRKLARQIARIFARVFAARCFGNCSPQKTHPNLRLCSGTLFGKNRGNQGCFAEANASNRPRKN